MKLVDRQLVDGTEPRIYIGRRLTGGSSGLGRGKWWAEWCVDGRRHHHGLKTANKGVAIRSAHDICRRYMEGRGAPRVYKTTVPELVHEYLNRKLAEGRAPTTRRKYEFSLNEFLQWCDEVKKTLATQVDERDFWAYSAKITSDGKTDKVRYDRQVLVCQLFKFAWKSRLIPEYPFDSVRLKKPGWGVQPCFTPEQVAKVLQLAKPRHRPIFAVLAYLGLRIGEARDLRWDDIHWNEGHSGMVVIRRGGSHVGASEATKNRRQRRIPLHPDLVPYLKVLPRESDRVFPGGINRRTGKPGVLSDSTLLSQLKRICERAGFDNPRTFKLHSFRHTFASMCARNNVSYKYALEWLGHSDSRILDIYYRAYDDTAQAAMRSINYPVASPAGEAVGVPAAKPS